MPNIAIGCGILLILIGIVGYVNGIMNNNSSPTALIPAAFGLVLAVLGAVARAKESLLKHLMHAALVIALIGFFVTAGRLIMRFSELTMSPAVISTLSMSIVCLAFVILGVKSFAAARQNR